MASKILAFSVIGLIIGGFFLLFITKELLPKSASSSSYRASTERIQSFPNGGTYTDDSLEYSITLPPHWSFSVIPAPEYNIITAESGPMALVFEPIAINRGTGQATLDDFFGTFENFKTLAQQYDALSTEEIRYLSLREASEGWLGEIPMYQNIWEVELHENNEIRIGIEIAQTFIRENILFSVSILGPREEQQRMQGELTSILQTLVQGR